MMSNLSKPILYLITPGATTETTTPDAVEFQQVLMQVSSAAAAGIPLIQIREKSLTARVLFALTQRITMITRGSATRVLVNDRADIAASAGADGVHLTTRSLEAGVIRRTFGSQFLIGASTHSLAEARAAKEGGADFAVFGPIFESSPRKEYGSPSGTGSLREAAGQLAPFPLIALGGISMKNAKECLDAGAAGIAGISLFREPRGLKEFISATK